ncbi:hypothetical protein YC2023_105984 [Brassica napus]
MMKFGESAARIKGSDGFVAGFVGGAIEFHERCEDYGSYGNRRVSRDDANKTMQRDPLVTRNDKATAERLDSVEKQIATIGEDSSAVMGIVTVPVFPDVDLRQWISWMEHYFARKGLTDFEKLHMAYGFIVDEAERYISGIDSLRPIRSWKHMKETLLWQFGADDDPEKIRMKASYDRGHKAFLEWEADKRRRSRLCSGDSGDITFTDESTSHNAIVHETGVVRNCSLSDLIQPALDSETVHERVRVIQTVPAAEVSVQSETILEKDVFAETGHEDEAEKEAEQVSKSLCIAAQEERLVAEMSLKGPDLVKTMALTTLDSVSVSSSDGHVSSSEAAQEAEVELKPASLPGMEQQADVKREISDSACVEQPDLFLEKAPSSSLVDRKLKEALHSRKESAGTVKGLQKLSGLLQAQLCHVQMKSLDVITLLTSEQQTLEPKRRSSKSWHFKYKAENVGLCKQYNHVLYYACWILHMRDWLRQRKDGQCLKFWHSRFPCVPVLAEIWRSLCKIITQGENKAVAGMSQCENLAITLILVIHTFERFRVENGSVWISSMILPCHVLYHTYLMSKRTGQMFLFQMPQILQVLQHFLVGEGEFHVKHKWRFKSVADTKPELQYFPLIFLCSSLWASLFSRVGVYESILICLWIVAVLFWRYDREEKKESELLIQELFRVSSFLSRLLPHDNGLLLMQHEGNLLRVRVQQSHKKKKSFKTYMFKYKQQLSKTSVWTEVLQTNVQEAYMYDISGDDGKVQSRDCGGLWSGLSVHKGNKVMQQRRRSKVPKSWMFKYKDKVETSAVTFDICRSCKTCMNEALISPILIFYMSTSSFFSSPKLEGKLVFMGEVLIDFYHLESDVANEWLSWQKE